MKKAFALLLSIVASVPIAQAQQPSHPQGAIDAVDASNSVVASVAKVNPDLAAAWRACDIAQREFQKSDPVGEFQRGPMGPFPPTYEKCAQVRDDFFKASDNFNASVHSKRQDAIGRYLEKK